MREPKMIMDATVVEAMWRWINQWPDKVSEIGLDFLEKNGPSMSIQPLSGTVIDKEYIVSSYRGKWPFMVYIRTNAGADEDRVDAFRTLTALWEWMRSQPLPDIGENKQAMKLEMTSLPSIADRREDGSEDYQIQFTLTYYSRREFADIAP